MMQFVPVYCANTTDIVNNFADIKNVSIKSLHCVMYMHLSIKADKRADDKVLAGRK